MSLILRPIAELILPRGLQVARGTLSPEQNPGLGPELAGLINDGGFSITLSGGAAGTVTQDASGVHFNGSNNIASVSRGTTVGALIDNGTIEVTFTIANFVNGGARVIVSGATTNHGLTGTTRNANGTYTERGALSFTSSSTNLIRVQATGTNGNNHFDITFLSVKRVL